MEVIAADKPLRVGGRLTDRHCVCEVNEVPPRVPVLRVASCRPPCAHAKLPMAPREQPWPGTSGSGKLGRKAHARQSAEEKARRGAVMMVTGSRVFAGEFPPNWPASRRETKDRENRKLSRTLSGSIPEMLPQFASRSWPIWRISLDAR